MSKFRNWLEEWFGISANENQDSGFATKTPTGSGRSSKLHVLQVHGTEVERQQLVGRLTRIYRSKYHLENYSVGW